MKWLAWIGCVAALAACSDPFADAACTLDSISHPIQIDRAVAVPFTDAAKLKVEACATREGQTPTCATSAATSSGERFTLGSPQDAIEGSLSKADDGNTLLALTVHVGEGVAGSTTLVTARVLDESDKELVKAEGSVRWSDESCHPKPSVTKL